MKSNHLLVYCFKTSHMRLLLSILIYLSSLLHVQAQQTGTIGISVDVLEFMVDDEMVRFVDKVYKGSPAEKAGVHAGDVVLTLNGVSYKEDVVELIDKLAGKPGTTVTLVVQRFGETKKFILTRQVTQTKPVVLSEAKMPALKSIREIDVSKFYTYVGECLLGDCKNGKGIYMEEDSVMVFATYKNGKVNGLMQARAYDFYDQTNYVNDRKEGKSYTYYDNGTTTVTPYKNDKKEGIASITTRDGPDYEIVYKGDEKISGGRPNEPVTKPAEKPSLEKEAQLLLKSLTKDGGKVIVDKELYFSNSYTPTLFKATGHVQGYMIAMIYVKGDAKAEGYFNYSKSKDIPITERPAGNFTVLFLKVATAPDEFAAIYFKSSNEKYIAGRLFVVTF
ncbi:MAG: family peptidase [Segetibacter sp.]|nr:family peptidase [Segetibacter sp.]